MDSNPQPFNHESGVLTTEPSPFLFGTCLQTPTCHLPVNFKTHTDLAGFIFTGDLNNDLGAQLIHHGPEVRHSHIEWGLGCHELGARRSKVLHTESISKLQALLHNNLHPTTAITAWLHHRSQKPDTFSLVLK